MSKVTTCIWFNDQAEAAAKFYVETFKACGKSASIDRVCTWGENGMKPVGTVLTVSFSLDGHEFIALDGGPNFTPSPAISMFVRCKDQAEVDRFWDALLKGGTPSQCGWLTDRFGVSWQVVPEALGDMIHDTDPARRGRVFQEIMKMIKLDLPTLQKAYDR